MKRILISVILLTAAFLLISGCGIGTPEQQAREQYEHGQRFDAEMRRLEREGLPDKTEGNWMSPVVGFIIGVVITLVLEHILWDEDRKNDLK